MSTHTPGPWRYWACKDGSFDSGKDYMQVAAGKQFVAEVRIASVTEADMRLMAAAPDLLKQLTDLLAMCERQDDFNDDGGGAMFERAHAAIRKATEV